MSGQLPSDPQLELLSERLGPLPLINHFIERLGLAELLEQHVPTAENRAAISHAQALGVLLRSIIVEREPIYRQQELASAFAGNLFGVSDEELSHLTDDRLGRALDRLFDADRAVLITDVVLSVVKHFGLALDRLHNDSTSISFYGQYRAATGRSIRDRVAPAITYGFSKDLRPDLKQLLFICERRLQCSLKPVKI
jgi:transposase